MGLIAFQQIKAMLLRPILMIPDFERPFILMVDASDIGARAVLMQCDEKGIEHLFVFSHDSLTPIRRTIQLSKSRLWLYFSHFNILMNTTMFPITAFTDHNPWYLSIR